MIVHRMPWREVRVGMTVLRDEGFMVVAPGPWPSDALASVVLVDEPEAVATMRAAGFTWKVIAIEETS